MNRRTLVLAAGTAAVVVALVLVGSRVGDPRVSLPTNPAWAHMTAPTAAAWSNGVTSSPEPIADAPATSAPAQPDIVTVSAPASAAAVSQIPVAVAASAPPSRRAVPRRVVHAGHASPLWFGLYVPGAPESMSPVSATESRVGRHAKVVNFFVADSEQFPASRCANIVAHGSTPLVTLEFWSIDSAGLGAITDGSKDAYLREFARDAKAFHKEIWLRPFHEMNTHRYPWGNQGSNTPAKLVAAYRHVHDIFADEGAANVKFVWSPNIDYDVASYYPGDSYVDFAAIDGYNTGQPWRSFASLFGTTYKAVAALTPKPIFIAETACAESPRKASWIADMFAEITTVCPRVTGVCWFDTNKEHDWRVNSSPGSAAAFKAGLAAH